MSSNFPFQYSFRTFFGMGSFLQAIGMCLFFLMLLPLLFTNFGLKLLLKVILALVRVPSTC